ncbi:MAG: hypothetical protein HYW07_04175 [Candidatus Latescibacteria bacterium]|nr:hypothetical protein [Candidatus Latescibacterota bacterium]
MRPIITLLLSFLLALPAAWAADFQALCAGQPASEEVAHACCHHQAPDCNTGAMTAAYCCQSDVPTAPLPASQAIPPAPSVSVLLLAPDLPLIEHLAGEHLLTCFAPAPSAAPPPALYQLHRAYRI